jgi:hypothetical protein
VEWSAKSTNVNGKITRNRLREQRLRAAGGQMRFLPSEEAVDFAESGRKRGQDRIACFLHLRDLVHQHPEAASASAVSFVQTLEAKVIAEKAAREKRLADVRRPRSS